MPATPETIYMILALNKIGANANMLNPTFTKEQLTDRINETEAKLLVTVNELYKVVKEVVHNTTIEKVVSSPAVNSLGAIVKAIKKAKKIRGTIDWNDFIKCGKDTSCPKSPAYKKDTPAIMVYSSGTTGASKGIQLTNDGINSTITEYGISSFEFYRGEKFFAQIPIWFSTGLCITMLVPLFYGVTVILEPIYDFSIFYNHITKYKPHHLVTAVALIDYLAKEHPIHSAYSNFKYLVVGGEYVAKSAELKYNEWLNQNGNNEKLHKGFGMCELGGTATTTNAKCNVIGSAGIPTPHVVVAAFDSKTNKELKYGERGEIRVCSPCRMLGYYKNEQATDAFFHEDEQGNIWACTGDMGYVTEDGNVYVDGRISSSYKNARNETVYLFDVERAILDVEQVRQCKTVVSEIDGEKMHVAHIVLTNGADIQTTLKMVKEHCGNKLPENHMPTLIKLYDTALPVAPSGKLNVTEMEKSIDGLVEI